MKYDGNDMLFNKYEMAGIGAIQIGIGAGLLAISSKQVKAGAWGKTTGNIVNGFGITEIALWRCEPSTRRRYGNGREEESRGLGETVLQRIRELTIVQPSLKFVLFSIYIVGDMTMKIGFNMKG